MIKIKIFKQHDKTKVFLLYLVYKPFDLVSTADIPDCIKVYIN